MFQTEESDVYLAINNSSVRVAIYSLSTQRTRDWALPATVNSFWPQEFNQAIEMLPNIVLAEKMLISAGDGRLNLSELNKFLADINNPF